MQSWIETSPAASATPLATVAEAQAESFRSDAEIPGQDLYRADAGPVRFIVVRFREGWRILYHGRRWGLFDHASDAVEAVLRLARPACDLYGPSEVLVQDRWGELIRIAV